MKAVSYTHLDVYKRQILSSYQVDSKFNRKISDATIYATRQAKVGKDKADETYVLGKIKDIYTQDGYDAFMKIYKKDKSKFLMYRHDPQTFEKVIEPILENYPNKQMNEKGKEVPCNPCLLYTSSRLLVNMVSVGVQPSKEFF